MATTHSPFTYHKSSSHPMGYIREASSHPMGYIREASSHPMGYIREASSHPMGYIREASSHLIYKRGFIILWAIPGRPHHILWAI